MNEKLKNPNKRSIREKIRRALGKTSVSDSNIAETYQPPRHEYTEKNYRKEEDSEVYNTAYAKINNLLADINEWYVEKESKKLTNVDLFSITDETSYHKVEGALYYGAELLAKRDGDVVNIAWKYDDYDANLESEQIGGIGIAAIDMSQISAGDESRLDLIHLTNIESIDPRYVANFSNMYGNGYRSSSEQGVADTARSVSDMFEYLAKHLPEPIVHNTLT